MVKIAAKEPVYIIIPVHNRKQTTLTCLEDLEKNSDLQRYHVVVVDDGSTDGTAEAIRELYPEVIVLSGNGDLWWTGAIAKGMEYAHQKGAEYFVWLNDDCLPDDDTLPQLVEFLKNHPDTIAAPTCYIQQGNSLIKQYNGAKGQKAYAANPGEIIEVDSLSGWCVGISAAVVHKIGVPDAKKFPHYCGDDMYIFRATRSGFKAYLIGDIKTNLIGAVHEMSDFSKYFRPGLNTFQTLQALFFNKKSPYRLSTRFFYFRERYGLLTGTLFFLIKAALWFKEWTSLQLKYMNSLN
ncbi:glycosyltransferase family 2 protein [Calothrix sp. PCC 7507]|uniref:glycosyltransferase family 2 protein n=1 Tax=Calothrix sp. PCC 7507 TaxID=99598 RepID=UPI00029F05F6|nr:glycosyltransferase family 2 protein [Calothrix sp. PCC 7507]AFY36220.1 glycosyl transferase family 2 [Calothrix sp. PCC 7507]